MPTLSQDASPSRLSLRRLGPLRALACCALAFLLIFVLNLASGAQAFAWQEALALLWKHGQGASLTASEARQWTLLQQVIVAIRLPRILVAALCGGALAGAGVICQGLFRNPLASADILATSSGATLAAVAAFYWGGVFATPFALPLLAAFGALLTTSLLLLMVGRGAQLAMEQILLLGFALSALCGALTSFVLSLALNQLDKAAAMMHWLLGGFSGRGWSHLQLMLLPVVVAGVAGVYLAPRFDILALGEEVAASLGLRVSRLKRQAVVIVALLVGSSVAVAGALPFIGLMVPHITRALLGPQHRPLFLASVVNGMSLSLLADLCARSVRYPLEVEVGVFTALLGAPFFFWLLWRHYHGHA